MTRTDRVTDISTSKKLVKWMGGVGTFLSWVNPDGGKYNLYLTCSILTTIDLRPEEVQIFPAYTTDDLIERLPQIINIKGEMWGFSMTHVMATYRAITPNSCMYLHQSDTRKDGIRITNALAQLVIFCGESGYLEEGKG